SKKKIMGLNAAKLYDIEVPAEYQLKDGGTPGAHEVFAGEPEEPAPPGECQPQCQPDPRARPGGNPPGGPRGYWPRLTRCGTRSSTSRSPRSASSRRVPCPAAGGGREGGGW